MNTILITGGAGFIGSHLVEAFINKDFFVVVMDTNETAEMLLLKQYGKDKIAVENVSITNKQLLNIIFAKYKPDYVIHAAAHKHVSLVELNPKEAIDNNIIGTVNVFNACLNYNVKKCLYISTDKADAPESVYGYTKKACEELIESFSKFSQTEFMAVRFCNILEAPAAVYSIFKDQIENNKPITVTDFRMERYFIPVATAVDFVIKVLLQVGTGGHIYMLDVGEQTNIYELAKKLRSEAGKEELPIVEIGILPGERLTEPYKIGNQLHIVDDIYLVR